MMQLFPVYGPSHPSRGPQKGAGLYRECDKTRAKGVVSNKLCKTTCCHAKGNGEESWPLLLHQLEAELLAKGEGL